MAKLLEKINEVLEELASQRGLLEDMNRRLGTLETDVALIRRAKVEDGKAIALIMDRCSERGELLERLTRVRSSSIPADGGGT